MKFSHFLPLLPPRLGREGRQFWGGQRPCCEALRLQREADQGKGQIEVTLSIGMCDSVGVGLPEGSAAVIVPGTHVDLGAAVQLTGGFDVHDVLHSSASFLVLVCFVYGTLSVDVIVADPERRIFRFSYHRLLLCKHSLASSTSSSIGTFSGRNWRSKKVGRAAYIILQHARNTCLAAHGISRTTIDTAYPAI